MHLISARRLLSAAIAAAARLCDVPRNLTDDQMRALAAKGGVAHTTLYHGFLRKEGEADIMDAIAHLEHAIDVMGIDHAGLALTLMETAASGARRLF